MRVVYSGCSARETVPASHQGDTVKQHLTTADLDRMTEHEDWHGFGYIGERTRSDAPATKIAAADMDVLDAANQLGMTYEQLFEWANSKNGRWYADCAFGSGRHSARYLPGQPLY